MRFCFEFGQCSRSQAKKLGRFCVLPITNMDPSIRLKPATKIPKARCNLPWRSPPSKPELAAIVMSVFDKSNPTTNAISKKLPVRAEVAPTVAVRRIA